MTFIPNGPVERALAVSDLPMAKPTPPNLTKILLVAGISLVVGGSVMYIVLRKKTQHQTTPDKNNRN